VLCDPLCGSRVPRQRPVPEKASSARAPLRVAHGVCFAAHTAVSVGEIEASRFLQRSHPAGLGFGAVRDQLAHIGHVQPYATHPARQRGGEWSENSHARVVVAFPCVASATRVPRQRPVPEDVLSL
jgi:hypothetical protein